MVDDTDFQNLSPAAQDELDGWEPAEVTASRQAKISLGASPDEAAQALKLAPQVGLPPAVVQQDVQGTAKEVQRQKNIGILQSSPSLSQVVADNPVAYDAMADDMDKVLKVQNTAKAGPTFFGPTPEGKALASGFGQGFQSQEEGRAAFARQITGQPQLPPTAETQQNYSGLSYVMQQAGSMAGQLASASKTAAVTTAGGFAVGGPVGAAAGLGYGYYADFAASSSGSIYRSLDQVRGENGERIPEHLKQATAITGGLLVGALTSHMGSEAAETVSGLVSETLAKSLGDKVIQTGLAKAAGTVAKSGLTFGALNAGMFAAQEILPEIAKMEADGKFKTVANDPEQRQQLINGLVSSIRDGVVGGAALAVLPAGLSLIGDHLHVQQTLADAAHRDAIMSAAEESATKGRAPEVLAQVIGNDHTVDVSAAKIAEIRTADPSAFSYVPDIDARVADAQAHGGDVSIPAGDYYAHTAPETHEAVKDDIRGDNGLTVNEAADIQAYEPQLPPSHVDVEARDEAEALNGGSEPPKEPPEPPTAEEPDPKKPYDPIDPIDPVVRAAMNAVGKNVESQQKLMWLQHIIAPNAAGMNKTDFARYARHIQAANAKLLDAPIEAARKEVARRDRPAWKNAIAQATTDVTKEFSEAPAHYADSVFRNGKTQAGDDVGPFKLDRKATEAIIGLEATKELSPKMFNKKGLDPNHIAEAMGFNSGPEMMQALLELQRERAGTEPRDHFRNIVKDEALRRVEAEHGKFDENVMQEAVRAALAAAHIDVLVDELKMIGANDKITKEMMQDKVEGQFARMNSVDAGKMERFQRLTGKYGLEAERALLHSGDREIAFKAKQLQIINFMLSREAHEFRAEAAKFSRNISPFLDKIVVSNVDHEFNDQIQRVLQNLGFDIKRDKAELAGAVEGKPLAGFIDHLSSTQGRDIDMPEFATHPGVDVSKLSVDQFRQVAEAINALIYAGRENRKITLAGQKADFEEVVRQFTTNLDRMPQKPEPRRASEIPRVRDILHKISSELLKIERIGDWFDNNDSEGPFNRIVMRPLQEAKYKEADMLRDYGAKLKSLDQGKAWRKGLDSQIKNELLYDKNLTLRKLTRHEMLEMMGHVGSDTNFTKLVEGMNAMLAKKHGEAARSTHGWSKANVMHVINENASKEDWDYVQGVWKIFDGLWPEVEALSRERSGAAPRRKAARDVDTAFGTIKGGYAPLRPDLQRAPEIGEKSARLFDEANFYHSRPPAGYTKEVTGALYPLSLEHGNTPDAIRETIHDLAYRKPIADADKFLSDERVKSSINGAFGPHISKLFRPYLEDICGSGGRIAANRGATGLAQAMKYQRINWAMGQLVGRMTTIVKHGASVLQNSMDEVGSSAFQDEFKTLYRNPLKWKENLQEIYEKSGELRTRWDAQDRDLYELEKANFGGGSTATKLERGLGKAAKIASFPYAAFDMLSAAPTWSAAYKQALMKGLDEEAARFAGDKAVRNAHGSSSRLDLSSSQRSDNEFYKASTVAMGFFNHVYNQYADTARLAKQGTQSLLDGDFGEAKQKFTRVFMRTFYYGIMLSMVEEFVSPTESTEGESWIWHDAKVFTRPIFSTVPILRDLAHSLLSKRNRDGSFDVSVTPALENIQAFEQTLWNINRARQGEKPRYDSMRAAFNAVNMFAPVPGMGQLGTTTQFLWDLKHGKQSFDNAGELARGLLFGHSKPRKD